MKVIDSAGNLIPVCLRSDTLVVFKVGIRSLDDIRKRITVWPNPSTGIFSVKINIPGNGSWEVTVKNLLGETVHTETAGNYFELDLSGQQAGYYFISVGTKFGVAAKGVVIQR